MSISKSRAVVGQALQESNVKFNNVNEFYVNSDLLAMTGKELLNNGVMTNNFLNLLVNKIGVTLVNQKMYKNPFGVFKKGRMPLGVAIEDIFINPVNAKNFVSGYNNEIVTTSNNVNYGALDPFTIEESDVKVVYYPLNAKVYFKVTIKFVEVQQAFTNWNKMDDLVNGLVKNLSKSVEIWEFEQTKQLLGTNFEFTTPTSKSIKVPSRNEIDWASEFAIKCRDLGLSMRQPSTQFNNWNAWSIANNLTGVNTNPVKTLTDVSDLHLVCLTSVVANIDINVLATSFNVDKAEFLGKVQDTINFGEYLDENGVQKIEEYPSSDPVQGKKYHTTGYNGNYDYLGIDNKRHHVELLGYIFDEHFIQIWETYNTVTNIENPVSLYRNYFKHLWEVFALCPFANAVALYSDDIVE